MSFLSRLRGQPSPPSAWLAWWLGHAGAFQRVEDSTVSLGETLVDFGNSRATITSLGRAWADAAAAVELARAALDEMPLAEPVANEVLGLFAMYEEALERFNGAYEAWTSGELSLAVDLWGPTVDAFDAATDRAGELRGMLRRM